MAVTTAQSDLKMAEWRVWGPIGNSQEEEPQGYLGVDYTTGCDTRWPGQLMLGPQFNTIDLSGAGGTPANANGIGIATGPSSVVYGYVSRGTIPAKVRLSDMTLMTNGIAAFPEAVTSTEVTKNSAAVVEVNFGHAASAYRSITTIAAPPAADTVTVNSAAVLRRILKFTPDRVLGALGQSIFSNLLTSGGTMASPSWSTLGVYAGPDIDPTGLAMNDNYIVWGTNKGPISLNAQFNKWYEIGSLQSAHADNCRAMRRVRFAGTFIPMENAIGIANGADYSGHEGTEQWLRATHPARGIWTALGSDNDWGICAIRNEVDTNWYITAFRPRQPSEAGIHPHSLSYFTIGVQTSACDFIEYTAKDGGRTNPTWMGGIGSNAWYMTAGRTSRWFEDSNYRYATSSQKAYLTELRRNPDRDKFLHTIEFEAAQCSATSTITIGAKVEGRTEQTLAVASGNGLHRFDLHGLNVRGWRLQPVVTLTNGGTNTTTPQMLGTLRVWYSLEPRQVNGQYRRNEVP